MGVFPTRVGVDRDTGSAACSGGQFSPHAWGWTGKAIIGEWVAMGFPHTRGGGPCTDWDDTHSRIVFPTRVGVDRHVPDPAAAGAGVFPTRVGVDRGLPAPSRFLIAFSPHAWGWTVLQFLRIVNQECFPHTRGGGPWS